MVYASKVVALFESGAAVDEPSLYAKVSCHT